MLGLYLNVALFCFGILALFSGISFFVQDKESRIYGRYAIVFGIMTFCTCTGYAVMGFSPDARYAFIPRLVGLYGIDTFLLTEFAFTLTELKAKKRTEYISYGVGCLYVLLDLIIFGRSNSITYIRYEYHTAYEHIISAPYLFHYSYISIIIVILLIQGIRWYKSKVITRDKRFSLEVILVNFVLLFVSIPEIFHLNFAKKYPTFSYSFGIFVIYVSILFLFKQHDSFNPTVKNVSKDIFYAVDVPVLIFSPDGKVNLFNPCAQKELGIDEGKEHTLRSIFSLTDVETLRLIALIKQGNGGRKETKIKANEMPCTLSYSVRLDNTGEPFCVVCTVLQRNKESTCKTK